MGKLLYRNGGGGNPNRNGGILGAKSESFHDGQRVKRKSDGVLFFIEKVTPYGLKLKDTEGSFASAGFTSKVN
jgi:hypothetical protein